MERGDIDRHAGQVGLGQTVAEQFGKEVMVTIPIAFVVQGHNKKIGLLQILQNLTGRSRRGGQRGCG